jgi:serine/threonine protein kinase
MGAMACVAHEIAASPREPGDRLAPGYILLGHLHRGELLDIDDVWSEERGCRCVTKTLRPEARHDAQARRHLLREGRRLRRLTHPHIVRAYATLTEPLPAVVLETLPGETLGRLVERTGPLSGEALGYLGLQLIAALTYLHRQGLLHLDLTPANVVANQGLAKIIDLSLARRPGPGQRDLGTPGFRAPELVSGGMLGPATDVYGIGAVLAFAADGQAREDDGAAALATIHASLPSRVAAAIAACLAPVPECRPDLSDLAIAFGELVASTRRTSA